MAFDYVILVFTEAKGLSFMGPIGEILHILLTALTIAFTAYKFGKDLINDMKNSKTGDKENKGYMWLILGIVFMCVGIWAVYSAITEYTAMWFVAVIGIALGILMINPKNRKKWYSFF